MLPDEGVLMRFHPGSVLLPQNRVVGGYKARQFQEGIASVVLELLVGLLRAAGF